MAGTETIFCLQQGTGKGPWGKVLQSKIHATQSDLCLLILNTSLLVDICRSGAVTQDFI